MACLGETSGYRLGDFVLEGYWQVRIPRRGAAPIQIGVVDVTGTLRVTEPDMFLGHVCSGYCTSRGWRCGLMMIRPV
jgi:CRISPR system Cascade subunit CasE